MDRYDIPKDQWPAGPWHNEPDEQRFELNFFRCRLERGPVGSWCGYVGVPEGHPWYETEPEVRVHGGISYSAREDDGLWWVGFDTAHAGDLMPVVLAALERGPRRGETYRDLDYVRSEVEFLAGQAANAVTTKP